MAKRIWQQRALREAKFFLINTKAANSFHSLSNVRLPPGSCNRIYKVYKSILLHYEAAMKQASLTSERQPMYTAQKMKGAYKQHNIT